MILIGAKFLRQKSPQPAALQFHSDWRRSEKRSEGGETKREKKQRKKRGIASKEMHVRGSETD